MNVLQICSFYTSSKLYKNLFENLDEKGINNFVYIPSKKKDININISDNTNIKYYYSNIFKNGNTLIEKLENVIQKILFYKREEIILEDITRKINLDKVNITHAHSLFIDGYVAYQLKKRKNIEYIVAIRNMDLNIMFKYMVHLRRDAIEILLNAKKVVFISPSYKELVINKYIPKQHRKSIEEKSDIIPNGIDDFWMKNKFNDKRKYIDNESLNLIFVGKINKNKNIPTIINVVKKINEHGLKCKLNIIGEGLLLEKLKKKYRYEYIYFLGSKNKEDIIDYYRQADIFIMCSKHETFGLVYVEAMSQGLPIIYTRGQGIDKYFKDGTVGYSVAYNNIDEIIDRISKITSNYEVIVNNCLNSFKEFNWNNISNIYKDIYQ